MLNLPLIDDRLAVRGVVYEDRRGGYINNVGSEFTRSGTDLGLALRNGGAVSNTGQVITPGQVPADSEVINNYQIATTRSTRSPTRAFVLRPCTTSMISGTRC